MTSFAFFSFDQHTNNVWTIDDVNARYQKYRRWILYPNLYEISFAGWISAKDYEKHETLNLYVRTVIVVQSSVGTSPAQGW